MPDDKKFPPSGRLFANNRKSSPNAPDVKGDLEIGREVLDHLIDCYENGQPIKMDIAGWKKAKQNGEPFLSLRVQIKRERQELQAAPQAQPFHDDPLPF